MSAQRWRYDGRRVVVTGCASGIGAHLSAQLADLGAHVTGLDLRRPDRPPAAFVEVDFADGASIDAAVKFEISTGATQVRRRIVDA